jgi:hypothetical protein
MWNEGNDSLSSEEMRKPLVISAGSELGGIIDSKILNVKSIIDDNFVISKIDGRSFQLKWKKFDPGMAISLVALHTRPDQLIIIGAFGPRYELSKFPPWGRTFAKWAIVVFGFLLALIFGFTSVAFFNQRLKFMNWRFGFPPFAFFLTVGSALGAGVGFGLFWLLSFVMNFYPPAI